jgi:hydrogenase-4 component B
MALVLAALAALAIAGLVALVSATSPRTSPFVGASGPLAACALLARPTLDVLAGGPALVGVWSWTWPSLSVNLGLDALSAVFLAVVLALGALTAVYGLGYLRESGTPGARGLAWFCFNILLASMVLVVLARDVIVFLVAWETMALTSFLLIAFDHEQREVRRAAWTYFVATHLGSLFLLPLFFLLGKAGGSLVFADFSSASGAGIASVCFLLAVVGFGTKAGVMPFHVWLPEAHPAAPSHVSALLSGVMIKMGIYGLLRILTFLGTPPLWWGWLLLALGGVSALLGVLFALAQHNLKRLLAFSSVENVGIIVLGLGVGVTGLASESPRMAALGFAGAFLHVVNHALFKGLLFLGAGSVLHATGTVEIDELGGLMRRMPVTATTFLVGALAISGLPPLNGFVSELLVYRSALIGTTALPAPAAIPLAAVIGALAAVGGLALACFTKAFGIVFLGHARSRHVLQAHEASLSMRVPMILLAGACVAVGLAAGLTLPRLSGAVSVLVPGTEPAAALSEGGALLTRVAVVGVALCCLIAAGALLRRLLLLRRDVRLADTWDCGYSAPSPSMQYTASSFAQPIVDLYVSLLRTRKRVAAPDLHFPDAARLETETRDIGREGIYEPLFESAERLLKRMRILQHGRVQVYVLSLVLTLVVLLLWQVR